MLHALMRTCRMDKILENNASPFVYHICMNIEYDVQLKEICTKNNKIYPQILKSKKMSYLWNYVLSQTKVLQEYERTHGIKYQIGTYVNWTLNHRTKYPCCQTCKKIFYERNVKWNNDYPSFCSIICMNKSPTHIKHVGDTLQKRYGERVPARIPFVHKKMENSCLKKYGVKNAWNNRKSYETRTKPENIRRRLQKCNAYNQKHFGVDWYVQSDEFKMRIKALGGKSQEEKQLVNWLKTFVDENDIKIGTFKVIYPKQLDIFIKSKKIGIEFNGTYYHSIEHGTAIDYHLMKTKMCEDNGIVLIHIWEDEWICDNQKVKDFIVHVIDGSLEIEDYLVKRDDGLFEVDRSKFNSTSIPKSYSIVGETNPSIVLRSKISKDKSRVPDCGKLVLKRNI